LEQDHGPELAIGGPHHLEHGDGAGVFLDEHQEGLARDGRADDESNGDGHHEQHRDALAAVEPHGIGGELLGGPGPQASEGVDLLAEGLRSASGCRAGQDEARHVLLAEVKGRGGGSGGVQHWQSCEGSGDVRHAHDAKATVSDAHGPTRSKRFAREEQFVTTGIDDGRVEFTDRVGPSDPHLLRQSRQAGVVDSEEGDRVEPPALGTSDGVDFEQWGRPGDSGDATHPQ
jgi:hypothetical protein